MDVSGSHTENSRNIGVLCGQSSERPFPSTVPLLQMQAWHRGGKDAGRGLTSVPPLWCGCPREVQGETLFAASITQVPMGPELLPFPSPRHFLLL